LYYLKKDYKLCINVCRDILTQDPDKTYTLRLLELSHSALGETKEALETDQKLYSLDPNINYLFKISEYQYLLKRYGECMETINKVLKHPQLEESTIFMHISKNEQQEVPMKAAMYNLMGMVHFDFNRNDKAVLAFSKAVEVYPEFLVAKQKIKELSKR